MFGASESSSTRSPGWHDFTSQECLGMKSEKIVCDLSPTTAQSLPVPCGQNWSDMIIVWWIVKKGTVDIIHINA